MMNDDDDDDCLLLEISLFLSTFFFRFFFFFFFFFFRLLLLLQKKERTTTNNNNNNQKSKDRREQQCTRRFSCTSATGAGQRSRTRRTSLDAGISSVRRVFFFSSSRVLARARFSLSLSLSLSLSFAYFKNDFVFSRLSRAFLYAVNTTSQVKRTYRECCEPASVQSVKRQCSNDT